LRSNSAAAARASLALLHDAQQRLEQQALEDHGQQQNGKNHPDDGQIREHRTSEGRDDTLNRAFPQRHKTSIYTILPRG
jgi:hypothetical protein